MKKALALILALCMLFSALPAFAAEDGFTYEELVGYVQKVNDYWINSHTWTPGYEWDTAAYYIGCMDAYYLTGIERYRDYATTWAKRNNWKGHTSTDMATWSNSNVYHADNQTCFQVYIDLYQLDGQQDYKMVERTFEVIDAQIATGKDNFWTWCDAIHMAAPVHAKLYALTGDEKYLDSLYRFFDFSKKRMYDGNGGINYTGEPVNLFFRDPGYIGSRVEGEKNIWARGVGWVMAAFTRIFDYVPETWEHYDYFLTTYKEMAQACVKYVKSDNEGRMYWTQSMLPTYPVAEHNPYGYETSGTAFITFSLYYGINAGLLDEATYLPVAEGCLRYLTEVAMHDNGFIGYVQHIGSAATNATKDTDNFNFGTGATLSALSEAARYYGGTQGDIYPYLTQRTMGSVVFKIDSDKIYNGINVKEIDAPAFIDSSGRTMVPLRAVSEALGAKVVWNNDTRTAIAVKDDTVVQFVIGGNYYYVDSEKHLSDSAAMVKDGRTYIPLRAAAEAFGKSVYWNNEHRIVMIGAKSNPFYESRSGCVEMLNEILSTGALPERAAENITYETYLPELDSKNRIKIISATASHSPEPENPPTNAFDDDISTRWASTGNCEIVLDLGEVKYVELVAAAFWKYTERVTYFEIHASADGVTYHEYYNGSTVQGEEFSYIPIKSDVRFIKVVGHGNSTNEWTSLLELVPYSDTLD